MKKEEIILSKYSPNILIIIGVIFNIIFASIFSLFWITLIITIPTIVLNAFLLIPRTNVKRYWAVWRILPVVLSLVLTIVMFGTLWFGAELVEHIYEGFAEVVNLVAFWTKDAVIEPSLNVESVQKILTIIFAIIGLVGNILIMCGWYSKKELGTLNSLKEESKKETKKKKVAK